MVERVPKTELNANTYRVDESKDATDDQSGNQQSQDQEGGEGKSDAFERLSEKTNWQVLFNKKELWQRNKEISLEDVDKIKFLAVNLKSNPALLTIRLFLVEDQVISTAFLAVPRTLAMQIKAQGVGSHIDPHLLSQDGKIRVTLPADDDMMDEEITRITNDPKEKSLSTTLRMLVPQKNWWQRLGIQDPVSHEINKEILIIYLTVLGLVFALGAVGLFLRS
ncbi:MAG: hypothetical protein H7A33_06770 [Deltaproteobacteria bacterium]|nr:hypothetical protein [Deltaproteobacteria bacterium]